MDLVRCPVHNASTCAKHACKKHCMLQMAHLSAGWGPHSTQQSFLLTTTYAAGNTVTLTLLVQHSYKGSRVCRARFSLAPHGPDSTTVHMSHACTCTRETLRLPQRFIGCPPASPVSSGSPHRMAPLWQSPPSHLGCEPPASQSGIGLWPLHADSAMMCSTVRMTVRMIKIGPSYMFADTRGRSLYLQDEGAIVHKKVHRLCWCQPEALTLMVGP